MSRIAITRFANADPQAIVDLILPSRWRILAGKRRRTAGRYDCANSFRTEGALRKMFVATPYRGREHGVAATLLSTLLTHARQRGMMAVTLGTTDRLYAAYRFYEENGFVAIQPEMLPQGLPRVAVDNRFRRIALG